MLKLQQTLTTSVLSLLLISCGGGGGSSGNATPFTGAQQPVTNQPTNQTPANVTPASQTPASSSSEPASTGGSSSTAGSETNTPTQPSTTTPPAPSITPFSIVRVDAPASGAIICSNVTLAVTGVGLRNVELVPEGSVFPKFGTFNVSADGTVATFTFSPLNHLMDQQLRVRIVAWDAPAGEPARTIVAMEARTWYPYYPHKTSCPTTPPTQLPQLDPAPTGEFTVTSLYNAPADGERVCGTLMMFIRGTNIRNAEIVSANGYFPKYGTFDIDSSGTFGRLYFNPANVPTGQLAVRILAWNAPSGQTGQEIVAMTSRTWEIAPGAPPCAGR